MLSANNRFQNIRARQNRIQRKHTRTHIYSPPFVYNKKGLTGLDRIYLNREANSNRFRTQGSSNIDRNLQNAYVIIDTSRTRRLI